MLTVDNFAVACELVEFLTQAGLEVDGHRLYNVHGEAPRHTGCW